MAVLTVFAAMVNTAAQVNLRAPNALINHHLKRSSTKDDGVKKHFG
jgi:hypothetical protein